MARAKELSWFNLVAGLLLGATAQPLIGGAVAQAAPGGWVVAQATGRAAQAHAALSKAIECHRQGDYEAANAYFKEVLPRVADLTPTEQEELKHFSQDNINALAARQSGARYLGYAEKAISEGDTADAVEQLKRASLNEQYLTADDKDRLTELNQQLRVVRSAPPAAPSDQMPNDLGIPVLKNAPSAASDMSPQSFINTPQPKGRIAGLTTPHMEQARAKVKQARAQLGQSNFEACEKLLAEAEEVDVTYGNGEDSPAKVREDLAKAKSDPKALLAAARSCLSRKDYDHAEAYAHLAEKSGGNAWTINLWADTPAKVLKDVQAARAQAKTDAAKSEAPKAAQGEKQAPGMLDSVKGLFGNAAKPDQAAPAKPADKTVTAHASPVSSTNVPDNTEAARKILKDGRAALRKGDLALARKCSEQARALKPSLADGEDDPEKLLADVVRAEYAAKAPKADKPVVADAKPPKPSRSQREEALELLKKCKAEMAENKLDDALKSAMQAKALNVKWGLFDDTPEALILTIEKARGHRNQEESVKVLAEGRRLLEQKDYDGAMKAAYRAQTLHGTYYIWDLGDRPESLLADVQAARAKPRTVETPADNRVVKKDTPPPAPPPSDKKVTPPTTVVQGPQTGDGVRQVVANEIKPITPPTGNGVRPPSIPGSGGGPAPTDVAVKPGDHTVKPAPADTTKAQALRLLEEARRLLHDGDLVGARSKCLEAEKLHIAFATNEEGAAEVLQRISRVAGQRLNSLVAEASERANDAKVPEAQRYQDAEKELLAARELATQFGLDTQMVDGRLRWVRHLTNLARAEKVQPPPAVGQGGLNPETHDNPAQQQGPPTLDVVHQRTLNPETQYNSAQQQGQTLLDTARQLLRAGKTAKAREAAEEACQDQYGVQEEALAVLRSIDNEEFAQSVLTERKKFAVVQSAYNRRDYVNARAILDTVNPKALTPVQMDRLKEMLQTPEMQPAQETAVAQGPNLTPTGPGNDPPNNLPPAPGSSGTGRARVTDSDPQQSVLKATEAMRVVHFDKLRKMGLEAQRQAAEKFRTGQTDAAMDTLKEYLDTLNNEHLDTKQLAMLKGPVESRLDQFRLIKEQTELIGSSKNATAGQIAKVKLREERERNKQERVSELMKQSNQFYRENKYEEALRYAQLALELDPDNGIAAATVTICERHRAVNESDATKRDREAMVLGSFRDTEREGPYADIHKPIVIDADRLGLANKRKPLSGLQQIKNPKERELESRMSLPVPSLHFTNAHLSQAINDLSVMCGMNIDIDIKALENAGISQEYPVTINLEQISLKSALKLLLRKVNLNLTYVITNEVVMITTKEFAGGSLVRNTIQVADLVIPIENAPQLGTGLTAWAAGGHSSRPKVPQMPTVPSAGGAYTPGGGAPVGSPTSSGSDASPFASQNTPANQTGEWTKRKPTQTTEDALINLIKLSIAKDSWDDMGGPGTIQYFAPTMSLVINQTVDIQEQIQDLLASLRALQDQEVAIEVRFITIADDFYERIGVDFNMDIQTNGQTAKYQPSLLSSTFAPQGFLNNAQFPGKGLISGLTPAGTLTNDLSIPIRPNSFNPSFPNFGGYIPGTGGLNIGLAFLSDIQVFLFLEAVAGDVRTNVMTAPKLTLENGQISTIAVGEGTRNFLTDINYVVLNNQIVAVPDITNIAQSGVTLTIQAVISADRRFVRLNPTLALTNISNTTPTAVIPVQLPLYPTLVDFNNGQQPVVFTQYISAPSVNTITVNTTVTVPDGGTVLMGGLKIMSEGRNEYGAPILSKIPYLNRLFKNTSFGRDARSLMIMVTPRIIIQAEEEERATGFVAPRFNQQ